MKYDIAEPLGVTVMLNAQLKTVVDEKYVGPDKNYKGALFKPTSPGQFSDCKGIKDVCDGAFGIWRGGYYFPDKEFYKNKLEIIPLDLRNEDKHLPAFNIGINIGKMNVYEI